jgi:3-oxoacyl-[acyl-carrier protein] reductase
MDLNEAKVLVTGGSSGIGLATARILKEAGAKVVINGRDKEKLEKAAEELGVGHVAGDVSDAQVAGRIVEDAISELGGLNVLINNAGYGYIAPLIEIEADRFTDVINTNVIGATMAAQAAAKFFIKNKTGNIINIASTSALKGGPNASPYNATKFALRGMTEAWRQELREHNIRVMLVNPSEVMTHFFDNVDRKDSPGERNYTEKEKASKLRGEEIAHTIKSMLAMDDRGFITEATIFATNPKV